MFKNQSLSKYTHVTVAGSLIDSTVFDVEQVIGGEVWGACPGQVTRCER